MIVMMVISVRSIFDMMFVTPSLSARVVSVRLGTGHMPLVLILSVAFPTLAIVWAVVTTALFTIAINQKVI